MKDKNEHKIIQFPKPKKKKVVFKEGDPKSPRLNFKIEIKDEE